VGVPSVRKHLQERSSTQRSLHSAALSKKNISKTGPLNRRENPGLKSETWATHLSFVRTVFVFLAGPPTYLTVVFAVDWVIPFPGGFALLTVAVLVIVVPVLAVTFT
jgi:hypothetical protein